MTTTAYHHIALDPHGVPWVNGANVKVVEIVAEKLAYDWSAEQIQAQHPHLTLAQVHSALAYYYDHRAQVENDLDQRLARSEVIISSLDESPVRRKLLAARSRP